MKHQAGMQVKEELLHRKHQVNVQVQDMLLQRGI